MELRQYFNTIRKWLWLIALSTVIATTASFLATRSQPSIYSAKTTLIIGSTIENANPNGNDIWMGQQLAQTYASPSAIRLETARCKPWAWAGCHSTRSRWCPIPSYWRSTSSTPARNTPRLWLRSWRDSSSSKAPVRRSTSSATARHSSPSSCGARDQHRQHQSAHRGTARAVGRHV